MKASTTYDSTRESLQKLLDWISNGQIQLPDFQRGWIWDDEHIRSLLASLSLSYPIGAVMLLETGNPQVRLAPRTVEGVSLAQPVSPDLLILDGQQRLTSLFQALFMQAPVKTRDSRKTPIRRYYYIDIAKAMSNNGDREDAIVALPEDRIVRNFRGETVQDFSTPQKEYEAGMFPLNRVFSGSGWRREHNRFWNHHPDKVKLFDDFEEEIIKRFEQYLLPIITLKKETPKVAVCQVFEKVNTGGVPLTVFELLTATFAADGFNLRNDWDARAREMKKVPVLRGIDSTEFLQAVTLLTSYQRKQADPKAAITCKRKDVLALTLADYKSHADTATEAFKKAARLLHTQRIFSDRDLPYNTQLIPLAAILAVLGDKADNDAARGKIIRWYWCGVFGELYGGTTETRFARDLPEVLASVDGGGDPSTMVDANFAQSRLRGMRTRNSAAYKGLSVLLLRDGGKDLRTGEPVDTQVYFDEAVDIHHIFPSNYCKSLTVEQLGLDKLGVGRSAIDCIINKTPLSAGTNRMIGGNPPSIYLDRIQKKFGTAPERMDEILASHLIDPKAIRADDFISFFRAREQALLTRIEQAMGKPVVRDVVPGKTLELQEEDVDQTDPDASIEEP